MSAAQLKSRDPVRKGISAHEVGRPAVCGPVFGAVALDIALAPGRHREGRLEAVGGGFLAAGLGDGSVQLRAVGRRGTGYLYGVLGQTAYCVLVRDTHPADAVLPGAERRSKPDDSRTGVDLPRTKALVRPAAGASGTLS